MAYDFTTLQSKLDKALQHVQHDISSLRTGKASPQLLDPVFVEAYGTKMRVHELANVSAPDPNLLMVSPWDKSILSSLEKAIASAGLNLNPVVDGDIIRIVVPSLTEERRKEMVKVLHQKIEGGRVMLRTIRTDGKKEIEEMKGEAGVSEDHIETYLEQLDKIYKDFNDKLDELANSKAADLMKV